LVDASQLATRGTAEKFTFTIGDPNGPRVTYDLRAGSVTNPFSLDALRAFRCPDAL
jgi:type VI secretion system protein ImpL